MLNFAKSLLLLSILAATPAAADPIIVMRPAIGAGNAGVLPQTAFSVTSNPGNQLPGTPGAPSTPSTDDFVFKSEWYIKGRTGPDKRLTSTYNTTYKAYNAVGVNITGYPFKLQGCSVGDGANGASWNFVQLQSNRLSNGIGLILRPVVAGKMGLSLTCQAEKLGDPSLVYDIELTAK